MTDGYYVAAYKGDNRINTIGDFPSVDDAIFHMEAARTFSPGFDPSDLELIVYDSDDSPIFSMRVRNLGEDAKIYQLDDARENRD
jgi:hypothetical protein